ncbi:MAG: hypothetical protein JGK17_12135 [Microcoleus sp. PH2017_10_PVI_O_A]|uniref:hypothetical protein n=1 Tax=unclassified Microcoleus TaxID=2642155 RepID=UPI001DD80366|nr:MULTISPECIES: hypothetical protein [unclassified Microcoleus]TAE83162.1 MAG: hypothetical protein EAZ83_10030 [Oscillatoriales cyanobacterium]MCC3406315.1 hypothetical protein [Microcoleus sp. PH2017_10_PVI_O_A]MCC3460298.1 hypothetical protein [Microcoleus sp. PH2017_11_PCY_U_A]MCC3478832.1 hypothetical protein [Microcoleus sp. PH2017_12_PCY_D_A]MCC3528444.1 hypothetical protein [Microcoleus sp. PH2017_21_RUC_O_A]
MSLDYPEYEKLRKQSWFLGLLWRIGDYGYYLGLFGALGSPLVLIYQQLTSQKGHLPAAAALFLGFLLVAFFACIFWLSAQLKCFALKRGEALNNKRLKRPIDRR